MGNTVEREAKLAAWAGFHLPELDGAVDGASAVPLPDRQLDATYYDTGDLRLIRWGLSLRFRSGDGPGDGVWTVKLPEGGEGPALVRREITFEGPAGAVPTEVARFVRAYVRTALLAPVAHIATRRRRFELRDAEDVRVGEIDDDEVSVYEGRRVAVRFREVEVEVDERAPAGLLEAVVGRLQAAGAGAADPTPKLVRALGPRALDPPEVVPVPLDGRSTVADVVRAALAAGVIRYLRHEPGVRLGDDPEDVHRARVAARRLRSDLRTLRHHLDPDAVARLRGELKWLGQELGGVRDADVLLERLRSQAAALPNVDARAAAGLLRRLSATREERRVLMLEAMDGDRYLAVIDAVVAAAVATPLAPSATKKAAKQLPRTVGRTWKRLRRAVEGLGDDPDPAALHAVRIEAKRARYAAEAAAPVLGKKAVKFAAAVARLQGVLGDLQDAVVAEAWLREAAAAGPPEEAVVAGELVALQLAAIEEGRKAWRKRWNDVLDAPTPG